MRTLIRNGTVVTPQESRRADVLIDGDIIGGVAPEMAAEADRIIDAAGKYLLPGVIDAHTHMGIPILDTWSSDDFDTGTRAAACGGVTTVMDFTVQKTGQTLPDSVAERKRLAMSTAHVDVALHCNITDFTAATTDEMRQVFENGVGSFKVFMAYKRAGMQLDDAALLQVFACAAELGAVVMVHAENGDLIDFLSDRLIAAGVVSPPFHAVSRPALAEVEAVNRAIALARVTGVTLYIVHLTSAAALEIIHDAQQSGLPVIAETCPQYLLLTREVYDRPDGHCYIASPPLREQPDCDALWAGLSGSAIAVVGTDHCPFTRQQKDRGERRFHTTPNGLPGVETLLPLVHGEGVVKGRLSVNRMVEVLCENPARIFGLYPRKGCIQEGSDADLVVFDPHAEWEIRAARLHSNTDWSPYEGWVVKGVPERVFARGREVAARGEMVAAEGGGLFLEATKMAFPG